MCFLRLFRSARQRIWIWGEWGDCETSMWHVVWTSIIVGVLYPLPTNSTTVGKTGVCYIMLYHVIAVKAQNQFKNDNASLRKLYLLLHHFTSVDWYTHIPVPTHKLSHEIIRSIWWRDLSYECQNRQQVSCPHGCWNASTRSFCLSQAAYTSSPQPLFESHCFLWKLRSNPIKPIGQEHYFE